MLVHMKLLVNEQRLPKLLVECANSSMPIEVRRVHLMGPASEILSIPAPAVAGGPGAAPGAGGPGAGGSGGGSGGRAVMHAAPRPFGPAGQKGGETAEIGPYDIPVDVFGLIYIYNPPDQQKLRGGAAAADKPAGAMPPGGPPALVASPGRPAAPPNSHN